MIFGNKHTSPESSKMNLGKSVFLTDMCRVCMMTSEYLKEVISHELTAEIIDMLNQFAGIDISMNDCLPSLICNSCYTRLRDSNNFKNLCIDSNNTLKNYVLKMQKKSVELESKIRVTLIDESINTNNSTDNMTNDSCIELTSSQRNINLNEKETNNCACNQKASKRKCYEREKNTVNTNTMDCILIETPPTKRVKKENKTSNYLKYHGNTDSKRRNYDNEKITNNNSNDCILIETTSIKELHQVKQNNIINTNNLEIIDVEQEPINLISGNQHLSINSNIEIEIIDVESFDTEIKKSPRPDDDDDIKDITPSFEYIKIKQSPLEYPEPSSDYLSALGLIKIKRTESTEMKNELSNSDSPSNNNNIENDVPETMNIDIKMIKKEIKKEFLCKICNDTLFDYGTYRRHLASHGELPFPCKICDKRFKDARKLKEHVINAHSGGRPYSCSQCEAKFRTLEEFTAHVRRHAGNTEPHTCLQCPRRFASARQLREHASVHDVERKGMEKYKRTSTGNGTHACSLCDRKFRKRCDLERHERVHSGEKPYECLICGGRFQQAHNLTKHMVTHTGMRSYTCDICHKTFGRSDVLARHMHVHEVSKPHSCNTCARTFARQSQLITHMKKRHSESAQEVIKSE